MKVISIVGNKGGVGKSTVATNLASALAQKYNVAIVDLDNQSSTLNWLNLRDSNAKEVYFYDNTMDFDYLIIDTPAAIKEDLLEEVIELSHKVIIPIKPGAFDMMVTKVFLKQVVDLINKSKELVDLCLVANMLVPETSSSDSLLNFIKNTGINNPINITSSPYYSLLSAHGLGLFDASENIATEKKKEWVSLVNWAIS